MKARGEDDASIERRVADCEKWNDEACASECPFHFVYNNGTIPWAVGQVVNNLSPCSVWRDFIDSDIVALADMDEAAWLDKFEHLDVCAECRKVCEERYKQDVAKLYRVRDIIKNYDK